eukprot:746547-Hanusia_phi.AAC.1
MPTHQGPRQVQARDLTLLFASSSRVHLQPPPHARLAAQALPQLSEPSDPHASERCTTAPDCKPGPGRGSRGSPTPCTSQLDPHGSAAPCQQGRMQEEEKIAAPTQHHRVPRSPGPIVLQATSTSPQSQTTGKQTFMVVYSPW